MRKMTAEDKALGDVHSWAGWGGGRLRERIQEEMEQPENWGVVPLFSSAAPPLLPPLSPMSWAKLG